MANILVQEFPVDKLGGAEHLELIAFNCLGGSKKTHFSSVQIFASTTDKLAYRLKSPLEQAQIHPKSVQNLVNVRPIP